MTTPELRASLVLWRRRHAFRVLRLGLANARDDEAAIEKWRTLRREAAAMIRRRERQIAARERAVHRGQLWMPGVRQMRRPGSGPMVPGYAMKGVLHTTEGSTLEGALSALANANSWPHFCVGRDGTIVQHIPLNQGARALEHPRSTPETNRGGAIQIEVVGFAREAGDWPVAQIAALQRVMRFIEGAAGVSREADIAFGDARSLRRMDGDQWRRYGGWCGHQHVPHNHHWDPGPLRVRSLM